MNTFWNSCILDTPRAGIEPRYLYKKSNAFNISPFSILTNVETIQISIPIWKLPHHFLYKLINLTTINQLVNSIFTFSIFVNTKFLLAYLKDPFKKLEPIYSIFVIQKYTFFLLPFSLSYSNYHKNHFAKMKNFFSDFFWIKLLTKLKTDNPHKLFTA
jgi:hypothetical protein